MKKIIIIRNFTCTYRDYIRSGGLYFEKKGYMVELWLDSSQKLIDYEASAGMYNGNNIVFVDNDTIEKRVKHNKEAFFFIMGSQKNNTLLKALVKYSCEYIIFLNLAPIPSSIRDNDERTRKVRIFDVVKQNGLLELITKSFSLAGYKIEVAVARFCNDIMISINPPKAIFIATKYCYNSSKSMIYFGLKEKWVRYIHSSDYDCLIENSRNRVRINEKFIAFCDSGFGNRDHDTMLKGDTSPTYAIRDKYFAWLGELFDNLETEYNMPVYIFGHPHTVYDCQEMCGRKIILGKSMEYFQNAQLFVYTVSTAEAVPIYYNIPLLRLYWPELAEETSWIYVKASIEEQKGKFLNLSNKYSRKHPKDYVFRLTEENRNNFIKKYMLDDEGEKDKLIFEVTEEYVRKYSES